ncbi:MAG: NAD+ synthase [Rhodobacteraceae bacterium]|nr:NAD+ synthase [Paracoccaceae bacterium]
MADRFRLTLAQANPVVGDLDGNAALARAAWAAGRAAGAGLVALPEMFLSGYQTQDLVLKPAFVEAAMAAAAALAAACADGPALGVGCPWRAGERLHNAWLVLEGGRVTARIFKHHLPNEGVFDERRLFSPGPIAGPCRIGPIRIGIPICEDAWHPDVAETLAETGADLLLVPNGSPYSRGRIEERMARMVARVVETGLPLVYLNLAGGQDDQVFDGASFALNPGGALARQLPAFATATAGVDLVAGPEGWRIEPGGRALYPEEIEADYAAMVAGLRDYCAKSGIGGVLLGLSGGVDSALVATIAADALGPGRVRGVMLPSEFTSAASREDAAELARRLGIRLETLPIEGPRAAVAAALAPFFAGTAPGIAEENIQARLRGLLLMALANKSGAMLLTTGNKSELAVGYATIYGDMAGGYNPIKDLLKTRVFATCRWRNATRRDWFGGPPGTVIPDRVIDRPPSAELRADQRDEDSLPPYAILDPILEGLVERDEAVADLVGRGFDAATVRRVEALVAGAEWKRVQAAPGTRLTQRAFGPDRRYPIVNRWRDPG